MPLRESLEIARNAIVEAERAVEAARRAGHPVTDLDAELRRLRDQLGMTAKHGQAMA